MTINTLIDKIGEAGGGMTTEELLDIVHSVSVALNLTEVDVIGHLCYDVLNQGVENSFDLTYEHDYNAAEAIIEIADILDDIILKGGN